MEKALKELRDNIQPTEEMSAREIRLRAKEMAAIVVDNFTGGLLRSGLNIVEAVTQFANELELKN